MLRQFTSFLYGSTPAEFKSHFGLKDSVERLRGATKRSVFGAMTEPAAVGVVEESRVRLQRVIPMVGNSFKPFFVGRFETRPDGAYLTGRFTMAWFAKAFMTVWFGFLLIMVVPFFLGFSRSKKGFSFAAFAPVLMIGLGVGLVRFGQWLSRNDAAWLSHVIVGALGDPMTQTAIPPDGPVARSPESSSAEWRRPVVLSITALFLLATGVMNIVGATVGISTMPQDPAVEALIPHSQEQIRWMGIGFGLVSVFLAFGVYRGQLWAWRLGLVLIAAAWFMTMLPMVGAGRLPLVAQVFMAVASVVVTGMWGWWWHAQRVHFRSDRSWRG